MRRLLASTGESQTSFARRYGVTPTNLGKYLRAELQPGFDVLFRLADRTGVSLDWLLCGQGGEGPVYRGQSRSQSELEEDVSAYMAREVAMIAASHVDGPPSVLRVDGGRVLQRAAEREAEALKEWMRHYRQTIQAALEEARSAGELSQLLYAALGEISDPTEWVALLTAQRATAMLRVEKLWGSQLPEKLPTPPVVLASLRPCPERPEASELRRQALADFEEAAREGMIGEGATLGAHFKQQWKSYLSWREALSEHGSSIRTLSVSKDSDPEG